MSAEGESVGGDARIEEFNLEGMIGDVPVLPYQLVEPLSRHNALTVRVGIAAMVGARSHAVHGHAKPDRHAVRARPEDEVQVAGVKAIDNAAALRVEDGIFLADGPVAGQCRGTEVV